MQMRPAEKIGKNREKEKSVNMPLAIFHRISYHSMLVQMNSSASTYFFHSLLLRIENELKKSHEAIDILLKIIFCRKFCLQERKNPCQNVYSIELYVNSCYSNTHTKCCHNVNVNLNSSHRIHLLLKCNIDV